MHQVITKSLLIIAATNLAANITGAEPFTISPVIPLSPPTISLMDPPTGEKRAGEFQWMHLRLDYDTPSPALPSLTESGTYSFRLESSFGGSYCQFADQPKSVAEYVAQGQGRRVVAAVSAHGDRKAASRSRFDLGTVAQNARRTASAHTAAPRQP